MNIDKWGHISHRFGLEKCILHGYPLTQLSGRASDCRRKQISDGHWFKPSSGEAALLAQFGLERLAVNQKVVGSTPI